MPISTQDFRRSIGCYDESIKGDVTEHVLQKKLNQIAAAQAVKVPQKPSLLTVLALLSVVSNTVWRNKPSQRMTFPTDSRAESENSVNNTRLAITEYTQNISKNDVVRCDFSVDDYSIYDRSTYDYLPCEYSTYEYSTTATLPAKNLPRDTPVANALNKLSTSISRTFQLHAQMLSDVLKRYDPLIFPGAEAAIIARTTEQLPADSVEVVKNDYSCIEDRQNITIAGVFYKIADTISHPVTSLALESQIISSYNRDGICPTPSDVNIISKISQAIDSITTFIISMIPTFNAITVAQNLIAPTIKMALDDLAGRNRSIEDMDIITGNILGYARSVASISFKKINAATGVSTLTLPRGIAFADDYICIYINREPWVLTRKNDKLYALRNDVSYRAVYNEEKEAWQLFEEAENDNADDKAGGTSDADIEDREDPFYQICDSKKRRAVSFGKLCSTPVESDPLDDEFWAFYQNINTQGSVSIHPHEFTDAEMKIISHINIGLSTHSYRVDKLSFTYPWDIYRVRAEDKLDSKFYHAVKMSNRLVPIKSATIYESNLSCEVYSLQYPQNSYRVEFYNGKWVFEPATSFYLSNHLKEAINLLVDKELFLKQESLSTLSVPGRLGLQRDKNGHAYLRSDGRFVKVQKHNAKMYVSLNGDDFIRIAKKENQFEFVQASLGDGRLMLEAKDLQGYLALHSEAGLSFNQHHWLNYHWNLVYANVKSSDYNYGKFFGSKITILLRLKYNARNSDSFFELPDIQWFESLKCNDDGKIWEFNADMYKHNQFTATFFTWSNRYFEAYQFAKKTVKDGVNEPVRIFDRNMKPLTHDALPDVFSASKKAECVQDYLKDNGGYLEINIEDYPQVRLVDECTVKERMLKIKVGFLDVPIFSFSQAIVVREDKQPRVFMTPGTDINLIMEAPNSSPPESVSTPRIRK